MKKLFTILLLIIAISAKPTDFTGIKIYINPGHGGYNGANDRNLPTINYALGDTLGFWESWSNLQKGLALRDMLKASGATVYMSRVLNRDSDDRTLSEISAEANANNVDAFLSIHSNALTTNTGTNYVLLLFEGTDNNALIPASLPMAQAAWPRLMSNQLTNWTHYTSTPNIRGDISFYGYSLGVLKNLVVPGFLSEGSFHDYPPETHRLLNKDYRTLEAINLYRYYCDYFRRDLPATGVIAGFVKSKDEKIVHPKYNFLSGTNDQWMPLHGIKVKLLNLAGDTLKSYVTDSLYNGIFAFYNLSPGTYRLHFSDNFYLTKDTTVTVSAATTTYSKTFMINPNKEIYLPNYPDPVQDFGTIALKKYKFGPSTPFSPAWLNQSLIKKVLYKDEKLYILTNEPKITIASAITFAKISEMNLAGITGGIEVLSDIAFTSDGYLIGCNKESISKNETSTKTLKFYIWDSDSDVPKLFFETQNQATWENAVVGGTLAVSGARWKCSIYTTSTDISNTKSTRIMGFNYEDRKSKLLYKFMKISTDDTFSSESSFGKNLKITMSLTDSVHFIIDSEKILPTEFKFEWQMADGSELIKNASFAEINGYSLQTVASGSSFFRYARHGYMVSPVCNADSTAVGVVLFDITNGLGNALKVSEKLPETGLGNAKCTYMFASSKVTGYDIDLIVLAQNQGAARFKTNIPLVKANIYASELKISTPECVCPNTYKFSFTLNENAKEVKLNILKNNELKKTIQGGSRTKGVNNMEGNLDDLPDGEYTWTITAAADTVERLFKISDDTNALMQFNIPRAVAVDRNFESPGFGRIYVSESNGGTVTNRTTTDGVYVLNSAFQNITNQTGGYAGGVSWITTSNSSPMRLNVAEDGKIYICDWADAHPGVWVMNPTAPASSFTPVFEASALTRAASGLSSISGVNVHGSISHCYILGKGDETRLFTLDEDYLDGTATSTGNILQYNIGKLTTPWKSAPSAVVYNDAINGNLIQNMNCCIAEDGRGGWWIAQYRAVDAADVPSLIHIGANGLVNFNSGITPTLIGNSYYGGMAVNFEGNRLAMGCQDEVKIFSISFSENNVPTLTKLFSIKPALGTNTGGLSFDRAGNVYVVSESGKRLGVWALPNTENIFTTPASMNQKITILHTGIKNLDNSGKTVRIFPNPASDVVTIQSTRQIHTIDLYNLQGQLMKSKVANGLNYELHIHDLPQGIYLLNVKTNSTKNILRLLKK